MRNTCGILLHGCYSSRNLRHSAAYLLLPPPLLAGEEARGRGPSPSLSRLLAPCYHVLPTLVGASAAMGRCIGPRRWKGMQKSMAEMASRVAVILTVNGVAHELSLEPRRTLLEALREELRLTGAKPGCNLGQCGACTVLVDGEAVYSCLTLAVECAGRAITTIEGLGEGDELDRVQRALVTHDALQCGFCTPGQVLAMKALFDRTPHPSEDDILRGMSGNLCRCGAYPKILAAARALASEE